MSLEQLRAFRQGIPLDTLGPTRRLDPDGFPLLESSELADAHAALAPLLTRFGHNTRIDELRESAAVRPFLEADTATRTRTYLALIERMFAYDAKLSRAEGYAFGHFFAYGPAAKLMALLFDAGVDAEQVAGPTLEWFNCYHFAYYGTDPLRRVLGWLAGRYTPATLPPPIRERLVAVQAQFADMEKSYAPEGRDRIDALLGPGLYDALFPVEVWAARATTDLGAVAPDARRRWADLLKHCHAATGARPTAKWLKAGRARLAEVEAGEFRDRLIAWFPFADAPRPQPIIGTSWENIDERGRMNERNATVLRGLLWLAPDAATPDLTRAVGRLAVSAYRKVRGIGPRAVKVGNAAVYALSAIGTEDALAQLALLKVKVRFGTAQKEIEKAFDAAARKLGVPPDRVEEMSVPGYELDAAGVRRETLGGYTAELRVTGTEAALTFADAATGKPLKSVPAKLKKEHPDELKDLQQALKDVNAMLPAQRQRIDGMFLQDKSWALAVWRERYLDHPLLGAICRRLIWMVDGTPALLHDGSLQDVSGHSIQPGEGVTVSPWHPVGRPAGEVLAWRQRLEDLRVTQPFKQAHREIYLLTDAERRTGTYSNRFAAHVLRQHQFNALCAARGWRNKLRLMVDDTYPPATRLLPRYNLRAEFWVEGVGDHYGTDTNESGVYLHLTTDQVRFYPLAAPENTAHAGGGGYTQHGPGDAGTNPLPLEQVPPLVLSEILRDVDLFVGVASVGNDPTWQDGGPEQRYRQYWQSFSFGDLSATAQTRKAVLESLLPRLKIRDRARLADRFLVVTGRLRTYKIHLGSGNILMEPNDQYLCIVPDQSKRLAAGAEQPLFLPFEGDATLAVILSKAFLLAADDKIGDASITRQIGAR